VGYVERLTRRRLPASDSFWTLSSERLLSEYLWNEGKVPSTGRLTLKQISREELLTAESWNIE